MGVPDRRSEHQCVRQSGAVWYQGTDCRENRTEFAKCDVVLRPCCMGDYGQCALLTESICVGAQGRFHADKNDCSEVNCLDDVCGFGGVGGPGAEPDQWFRFFLPVVLHGGFIHLAFNAIFILTVGMQIERSAGALRVAVIFIVAGVGANAFSGIFAPYQAQVGASGSLYALIAVNMILLIQEWGRW